MGRILIQAVEQAGYQLAAAVERPESSLIGADAGELAGIGSLGVNVVGSLEEVVKQCDVVIELGPLLPMLGHPRQVSQAVMNLLLNAAQAMKERGTVYVSTRPDGEDDVVLTVRDTGVGMAPEVQANLFQPFFTTRPEGDGTGLGLAVVHGIITSHGGRIRVESQPGQGSTFTVRLPRVPPMKFIAEQHEPEQQPGASTIHVFKRPRVAPGTVED